MGRNYKFRSRNYKFRIGQRVKMIDEYGDPVYGHITDQTTATVFIQWEGSKDPTEYNHGDLNLLDLKLIFTKSK